MNNKSILILLGLVLGFLGSCITDIKVETEGSESSVVIQGKITTDKQPVQVTVRNSALFAAGPTGAETPISNANVKVTDSDGVETAFLEVESGVYQSTTNLQGGCWQELYPRSYITRWYKVSIRTRNNCSSA